MSIKKYIPNAITCCNLLCGCFAVLVAFKGEYTLSFAFILAGGVFDFFDGFLARLLGVSSPIGKELDSLADVITFGFAPSAMLYTFLLSRLSSQLTTPLAFLLAGLAFLMVAFSALRLAKFNLDTRQTTSFIGLPTPANALFWASLITGILPIESLSNLPYLAYILIVLIILSCYLLTAEIPMFALKFKGYGWHENQLKYVFILISAVFIMIFDLLGWTLTIVLYVIMSLITSKRIVKS